MQTLSRGELHRWKVEGKDFAFINVLPPEDYAEKHIPGSQNVPHNDPKFVDKVAQVARDRDRPVVVYCASTQCQASPDAARALEEAGFTRVYDYEGGMKDWEDAGLPVDGAVVTGVTAAS